MENSYRQCETLILLVGSNPLPNYITARILKPKTVVLLYTTQTQEVMRHLQKVFSESCIKVTPVTVEGTKPWKIQEELSRQMSTDPQLKRTTHLNYTGGTKVMAAHARWAFKDNGGSNNQSSYLDEREGVLRFDDGYGILLADQKDFGLSLTRIAELHGIKTCFTKSDEGPTLEDAKQVLTGVMSKTLNPFGEGSRLEELSKVKKALDNPVICHNLGLNLSVHQIPDVGWSDNKFKIWFKFLKGIWLEICIADLIKLLMKNEPSQGINCTFNNGRKFEIDVGLVRGHRLFVVSCTTSEKLAVCKSKLFEVAMRSRQLGGDLARSALVCLLDGGDSKSPYVDQLKQDVESVWDVPNKPQVFGAADLREWFGFNGESNLDSLKKWLDS